MVAVSAPVGPFPSVLDLSSVVSGGFAVGRSAATLIVSVAESVRPQFRPLTVTWYVPGWTSFGAVNRTLPLSAVQPKRLGADSVAVQPAGTPESVRRTRSKNVELRMTWNGASTVPPFDGTVGEPPAASWNVPRVPMRDT